MRMRAKTHVGRTIRTLGQVLAGGLALAALSGCPRPVKMGAVGEPVPSSTLRRTERAHESQVVLTEEGGRLTATVFVYENRTRDIRNQMEGIVSDCDGVQGCIIEQAAERIGPQRVIALEDPEINFDYSAHGRGAYLPMEEDRIRGSGCDISGLRLGTVRVSYSPSAEDIRASSALFRITPR